MLFPIRVGTLLRSAISGATMLAVAFTTFVLIATPFLIDLVGDEYGISLTMASLVGVVQLGGFVLGSFGAGRLLAPSRRVFIGALAVAVVTNLLSVLLPSYGVLLLLRFGSGTTLGIISWFAWAQVFGDKRGMADVAVIGPLAGVVASPIVGVVASEGGLEGVFALLAGLACVPLLFSRSAGAEHTMPEATARSQAVPVARALLALLGLFTLGGSAVFQYVVVIGVDELELAPTTIAWVLSANALIGIPAARWRWGRGTPGIWVALTGVCAIGLAVSGSVAVFAASIVVWGFAYWMGIPGVFTVLSERSRHPSDRAGDAQAIMATGRVAGPFLGGAILDAASSVTLGFVGGSLMIISGLGIFAIRVFAPPVEPLSSD